MRKNFSGNRGKVPLNGTGMTEQENTVNEYARPFDLSLDDAMSIVFGESAGIDKRKVTAFVNKVEQRYGSMELFRSNLKTCET